MVKETKDSKYEMFRKPNKHRNKELMVMLKASAKGKKKRSRKLDVAPSE